MGKLRLDAAENLRAVSLGRNCGTALLKFETQQGNLVSVRPSPQIFVPPREVCGVELGESVAALGVGALGAVVPAAAVRRWVAQLRRSLFLRL